MTPQQIEAMKLALEALEGWRKGFPDNWGDIDTEAVTSIKEALAQPEQIQPSADSNTHQPERHELQAKGEHPAPCARHCEANAFQIVIKNLKAQLAQPEQKPVAWMGTDIEGNPNKFRLNFFSGAIPLFTTPPQRKPLTDEEIVKITSDPCLYIRGGDYRIDIARAIEAAHGIKENT